jgi:predicted PurR-regulated permease PerM
MSSGKRTPTLTDRPVRAAILALALFALVAVLKWTRPVSLPLALALFLAILLRPVQAWAQRVLPSRLKRTSTAVAMLVLLLAAALFAGLVTLAAVVVDPRELTSSLNRLSEIGTEMLEWARGLGIGLSGQLEAGSGAGLGDRVLSLLQSLAGQVTLALSFAVLVFFLVLLILLEWDGWARKLERLSRGEGASNVLDRIAVQVRRYLLIRTITSGVSGLAWFLYLWVTGVELAFIWGLLAFALNYIPNIGSILATIPPSLMALIQMEPLTALAVIAGLVLLEQIIGNYVDPRIQGYALRISTVVVVLSIIFWSWVWGAMGALLAVPITLVIAAISAHVPALEPVAVLLGTGDPPDTEPEEEPG